MKKIEKLYLSNKTIQSVAEDIDNHFSISRYLQFLIKHDLLSFDTNEYPASTNIDFFSSTLGEIDVRLFSELARMKFLSNETKNFLLEEDVNLGLLELPQKEKDHQSSSKTYVHQDTKNIVRNEEKKSDGVKQKGFYKTFALFLISFLLILVALSLILKWVSNVKYFLAIIPIGFLAIIIAGIFALKYHDKIEDVTFGNIIMAFLKAIGFYRN